ncbi:MAG: glucose 1-dehydrogenase [Sphaerobacteraceae bacterium]|nr:MAG: glucose 1-dehydrogenase [Sphaerobacteraceae bacterium]
MSQLEGKLALVTGAGIGIGQGIAIELAKQGAAVAVHYAGSADGAKETVAQIEQNGGKAVLLQGNLAQVSECRRIVDEAADALGGLDIMVNNSGVTRSVPFLETTEETYDEQFNINIKGMFFCSQQAVPYILKRGGGSILNLTSVHGFGGIPNHTAYASTKGAIIAFTRQLSAEMAPQGIRVNAIGPGLIEVPRYFDNPDYTSEQGATRVPWGRVGKPYDIATAAAFLVSEAADFVTGQVLYVDGGSTARLGLP